MFQTQYSVVTSSRGTKVLNKQRYQQRPTTPVVVKHVFTSSQGYPVTMAVLPQAQPTNNPEVGLLQANQQAEHQADKLELSWRPFGLKPSLTIILVSNEFSTSYYLISVIFHLQISPRHHSLIVHLYEK